MTRLAAQPKRAKRVVDGMDEPRPFEPGTTGWSVADLDDPRIERLWFAGAYEIIEGVLTKMPPAYYDGAFRLRRLEKQIERFGEANGITIEFIAEADIVISDARTVRADSTMVLKGDLERFDRAATKHGKAEPGRQRIYVPPSLIIESVSPGHESHDRQTKFRFYADLGVPNYWIFDALRKSLDCYVLIRRKYVLAAAGTAPAKLAVPFFDGLKIDLRVIFDDKG